MDKEIRELIALGGAQCKICGQRMLKAKGCTCKSVKCGGKIYERIKYGEESYLHVDDRCHDCGAMLGQYHHADCDVEECPVCGGQFIGCDCDLEYS